MLKFVRKNMDKNILQTLNKYKYLKLLKINFFRLS